MSRDPVPEIDWLSQSTFFGATSGLSTLPRRNRDKSDLSFSLGILRNHPVEITGRLIERFSRYLGVTVDVRVGDYDDSFAFGAALCESDAVLVWPDWGRIPEDSLPGVMGNIKALGHSAKHLLVVAPEVKQGEETRGSARNELLCAANLGIYPPLGAVGISRKSDSISILSGSEIPFEHHMSFARDVAVGWIGSIILPPLKMIVVDLDNTLYSGVLGEDGCTGIRFDHDHLELLRKLDSFRAQGVLVCVSTRNDPRDLEGLREVWPRVGFALQDAALVRSTWDDKGDVIAKLISDFSTVPESVMFLDDNPGELANAVAKNPGLWPVLADSPAAASEILVTQRHRISSRYDTTAGARVSDARAAAMRSKIIGGAESLADLHARLGTTITTRVADQSDRQRVADIFLRTNQFNLALKRMDDSEVDMALTDPCRDVVVASVRDRLSDSGIVAAMTLTHGAEHLTVDEMAISCRVLGRGLETVIISEMLSLVSAGHTTVNFTATEGPRNAPALMWLENFTSRDHRDSVGIVIQALIDADREIRDSVEVVSDSLRRPQ